MGRRRRRGEEASSSTFWRTRATWDGQLKESGQQQTTVQQLLVEKYRVSNRNIDFPSVFDINIGVDCTIGKQLILWFATTVLRVPLPNIVISNWSLVPKLTTLKLTYRWTKSLMYSTNIFFCGMQPVFLWWFYTKSSLLEKASLFYCKIAVDTAAVCVDLQTKPARWLKKCMCSRKLYEVPPPCKWASFLLKGEWLTAGQLASSSCRVATTTQSCRRAAQTAVTLERRYYNELRKMVRRVSRKE